MKAFPTGKTGDKNHDFYVSQDGMDLRDYFAAQAMQGLLSNADIVKTHQNIATFTDVSPSDILCKESYFIADAMMKAREK